MHEQTSQQKTKAVHCKSTGNISFHKTAQSLDSSVFQKMTFNLFDLKAFCVFLFYFSGHRKITWPLWKFMGSVMLWWVSWWRSWVWEFHFTTGKTHFKWNTKSLIADSVDIWGIAQTEITVKPCSFLLVNTANSHDKCEPLSNLLPSYRISDHTDSYYNDWISLMWLHLQAVR